jgi:enoyl-CoA hydratase/carnithine racemase
VEERPLLVQKKNNLVTMLLNRPEKKNSLSPELVEILNHTLEELSMDDSVRVVMIRGSGDQAFCSGYDIRSLPTRHHGNIHEKLKTLNPVESLFKAVVNFPFPVIAMINGVAFGAGCELAICCDIRIAAENVRMGMPPAKLGLVYPWSGLQRFIQTIGFRSTREIFLTGRSYEGQRLKEIGLVDYLVSGEALEAFTYQMAEEIAANAPLALKGTKRVLNLLSQSTQFEKANLTEAQLITEAAFLSEDLKEGRQAFMEKRKPQFRGK